MSSDYRMPDRCLMVDRLGSIMRSFYASSVTAQQLPNRCPTSRSSCLTVDGCEILIH